MASRPVLIGRGLVTPHTEPHRTTRTTRTTNTTPTHQKTRVHHPEAEPTNPPPNTRTTHRATGGNRARSQQNNGSPRYGGHSGQETPGPIPNPEVKPASANGTAPDRMWESRTPPNNLCEKGSPQWWPLLCICQAFRGGIRTAWVLPWTQVAGQIFECATFRPQAEFRRPSSTGRGRARSRCPTPSPG